MIPSTLFSNGLLHLHFILYPASISFMSIIFNALPLPPPISDFGEPFYRSAEQAIDAINIRKEYRED